MFLALHRVFKSKEPLYFESSAEADVVRRSPKTANVFVSSSPVNHTHDLPWGICRVECVVFFSLLRSYISSCPRVFAPRTRCFPFFLRPCLHITFTPFLVILLLCMGTVSSFLPDFISDRHLDIYSLSISH